MFNIEREDKIIEILKEKNSISVNDLAKILFTSTSTIRRDLTNLENKGLVVRTFGGVYLTKNRFNKTLIIPARDKKIKGLFVSPIALRIDAPKL